MIKNKTLPNIANGYVECDRCDMADSSTKDGSSLSTLDEIQKAYSNLVMQEVCTSEQSAE
jgi:hypothetical protein